MAQEFQKRLAAIGFALMPLFGAGACTTIPPVEANGCMISSELRGPIPVRATFNVSQPCMAAKFVVHRLNSAPQGSVGELDALAFAYSVMQEINKGSPSVQRQFYGALTASGVNIDALNARIQANEAAIAIRVHQFTCQGEGGDHICSFQPA